MQRTILEDCAIRVNGEYEMGVADLDIGAIEHETITIDPQGGQGKYDVALAKKKPISVTVNSSDINAEILAHLGVCGESGDITAHCVVKDVVSCTSVQHIIEISGGWTSFKPSAIKIGETKHTYKISVRRLKWKINGTVVIDFDALAPNPRNAALLGFG